MAACPRGSNLVHCRLADWAGGICIRDYMEGSFVFGALRGHRIEVQ
jgi:hypothetical protein